MNLIGLLIHSGRLDEAEARLQRHLEAEGDLPTLETLLKGLEGEGRVQEALVWLQRAADAADPNAQWRAVNLLERLGCRSGREVVS